MRFAFESIRKHQQAIDPAASTAVLEEVLPDLDLVLVMTVNPGFGHQHFIHSTLAKIQRVRRIIQ